jgi:pimeloyl-CoA dehydrogenase small subunit
MDFDLTEEQSLLKDSVARLLADNYNFEARKTYLASAEGYSADMWQRYAEMGLLALPFAEEDGGFGGGPVETMIVMEAMGRALCLEPYLGTVILGGGALRLACTPELRAGLAPKVAGGSLRLALATTERNSRYDLHHVETSAKKSGTGHVLSGAKSVVFDGDGAGKVFVTARTAGGAREEKGIGLFLVDADAKGVTRRGYAMQDGRRAAEFTFDNVEVGADAVCGDPEGALAVVRRIVDQAIAALSAEAVGVMDVMREQTVEYLKVRKQFGVPIGAFQVLQHAAVDMFVASEQARSITLFATMMADSEDAGERAKAMAAAKAEIGRGGQKSGEIAVQLHGGIGMTMEAAIGHYFKRITMIDKAFGDADYHLERLADSGGLFAAR